MGTGIYNYGNSGIEFTSQGTWQGYIDQGGSGFAMSSIKVIGFATGENQNPTAAFSYLSSGKIAVGNGLVGDTGGTLIAGNVGIGTTGPTSILHTVASGAKTAAYSGNLLTNTATSSTASITKAGLEVTSTGTWNGTSASNIGLYVSSVTGGTNNYDAIFNGGGNVGIGTTSPTNILSFGGNAAREIWLERNSTTNGSNLTIQAGGGLSGGTNLNGGSLYLSSGISTGSGFSDMFFQTATAGSSGTADVTPTTKFTVRGNGNVVVGTGTALATNATTGFLYIPTSAGAQTGTPVADTTGTAPIAYDTTNNRLYVYNPTGTPAWHYIAVTAGFQIPNFETADPISGEKIKEGDIVLGRVKTK